ncbi:Rid family hydrolase, partial [Pantoea agglomerans]|uniref:Rid family hydrolase n=1 Tax=Enterobacter agglomerans TaxID=549 RepID=UPI001F5DEF9F
TGQVADDVAAQARQSLENVKAIVEAAGLEVGDIVKTTVFVMAVGNLTSHSVLLGALGFFIIAILASRNIHAAVLISMVVTT